MTHLHSFVVVAEEMSFRRAAERLKIHRPQLSRQISSLERELGVRLLERDGRTAIALTPAGQVCLAEAKELLARTDAAYQNIRDAARGEGGALIVSNYTRFSARLLSACLEEYRVRYPKNGVSIVNMRGSEQLAAVLKGTVHLAVRSDFAFPLDAQLQDLVLATRSIVVIFSNNHRLAKDSLAQLNIHSLANETLLWPLVEQDSCYNQRMEEIFQRTAFKPRDVQVVQGIENLFSMVSAGYGVAILPDLFEGAPGSSCQKKCLEVPMPPYQLSMTWRKDVNLPALNGFLEVARRFVTH